MAPHHGHRAAKHLPFQSLRAASVGRGLQQGLDQRTQPQRGSGLVAHAINQRENRTRRPKAQGWLDVNCGVLRQPFAEQSAVFHQPATCRAHHRRSTLVRLN